MGRNKRRTGPKRRLLSYPAEIRRQLNDESPFQCKTCGAFCACIVQPVKPGKWCHMWYPENEKYFTSIRTVDLMTSIKVLKRLLDAMPEALALVILDLKAPDMDIDLFHQTKTLINNLMKESLALFRERNKGGDDEADSNQ